jgi:hypothetical protein
MSLWRRWKTEGFVYCFLLGISISLPVMTVLDIFWDWPLWSRVVVLGVINAAAFYLFPYWRIRPDDTARYLDEKMPELEESCGLLLRPVAELGPLQQLQLARTEARLAVMRAPHPLRKRLLWVAGGLVVACLFSWEILFVVQRPVRIIAPVVEKKAPLPLTCGWRKESW